MSPRRWVVIAYADGRRERFFPELGIAIDFQTGSVRTCQVLGLSGR